MPEETARIADALSRATTGAETPNAMRVRGPSLMATICQAGALFAACVFAAWTFVLLDAVAHHPLVNVELLERIVTSLAWMGGASIGCVALSGLSQFFSHITGEVGGNRIEVENGR